MLTWGILKNVNHVVQRVVFLHEDLMKLPSFPRKALEAELDLYVNGELGKVHTYILVMGRAGILRVHGHLPISKFVGMGTSGICPFGNFRARAGFFTVQCPMACPIFWGLLRAWANGHLPFL